jgi:hypothetical protein
MHVEGKIMEAESFLSKIEENYNVLPDVTFYFDAFLASACSILDYLSEDYSNEFKFKISFNSKSFKRDFNNEMKKSKDRKIQEFYKWITDCREQIEQTDTIGSLLTQKRHRITHRHHEPPTMRIRLRYKTSDNSQAKIKEFFIPWFEHQRTISDNRKLKEISKNVIEIKTILAIDDHDSIDMEEACTEFLNKIKKIVNNTLKKFPLTSKA